MRAFTKAFLVFSLVAACGPGNRSDDDYARAARARVARTPDDAAVTAPARIAAHLADRPQVSVKEE